METQFNTTALEQKNASDDENHIEIMLNFEYFYAIELQIVLAKPNKAKVG